MIRWKKTSTTNDNCSVVFHISVVYHILIEKKIFIDKSRQKSVLSFFTLLLSFTFFSIHTSVAFHILIEKKISIDKHVRNSSSLFILSILSLSILSLSFCHLFVTSFDKTFLRKKKMSWSWMSDVYSATNESIWFVFVLAN